jgi:hypothetical protein
MGNSTTETNDSQAGGDEWALREAEQNLIDAGDDPVARAQAMHRHAEAIRNMMQTVLVPSFKQAIEGMLKKQTDALSARLNNSDNARLMRNAQLQDHIDNRFDGFGEELTKVAGLVQEVQASQSVFQIAVDERLTNLEADRNVLRERVTRLEAVNDRLAQIETYIAGSKRAEVDALRREIDALKQARGDNG